jgi:protoporphyrin/coproporphyrin ferrochelatase
VPRERLLQVAEHYQHFGGVSPLNAQNRALAANLEAELATHGRPLPVYLGNRNWQPFLEPTVRRMRDDGVRRALALVTSAFSSYSSCRQYRENVIAALGPLTDDAPVVDKIRAFFNHPLFVEANAANLRGAVEQLASARGGVHVVFTAHSIPTAMATQCAYEAQLHEAARLVAEEAAVVSWELAYQSRSGPPQVPWLEPDIIECLDRAARRGEYEIVVLPIGFVSDHMEVLYDLDVEAQGAARARGIRLVRAPTVGVSPVFVTMLRELVEERFATNPERRAIGRFGPSHDCCPVDCCLDGRRPPAA